MHGIDHIYIAVSDLRISEQFYDVVLMDVLGFRKNTFELGGDPHVQYFDRYFGYVIRPARLKISHEPYAPGLHHVCLRMDTPEDVTSASRRLREAGIETSDPRCFPDYAPDYWATFLSDPDGIRLEITNYRSERRERHDNW